MDIDKTLTELIQERDLLNNAIVVLERIVATRPKRRGRPPAWLHQLKRTAGVEINAQRRDRPPANDTEDEIEAGA